MNNEHTYDPTDEARGWHKYPAKTRGLRRFEHRNGTRTYGSRTRAITKVRIIEPTTLVTIHRKRAPRADIGTTLARAESLGLDIIAVRDEYRHRADNGYKLDTLVSIETNATFRGA